MDIFERPVTRLAAYAVGLVLVFGAGLGLGSLTASDEPGDGPPAITTDHEHQQHDEGALR